MNVKVRILSDWQNYLLRSKGHASEANQALVRFVTDQAVLDHRHSALLTPRLPPKAHQ